MKPKKNLGGRPSIPPYDKATEKIALTPRQVEAIEKISGLPWREATRQLINNFIAGGVCNEQK